MELELEPRPSLWAPGASGAPHNIGRAEDARVVLALVRLHGHPIGTVYTHVPAGADTLSTLTRAAHAELGGAIVQHLIGDQTPSGSTPRCLWWRERVLADAPMISVVVCTRDRPDQLTRCLASLARLDYPNLEVVVVDNDPPDEATERLVRERFGAVVTYVREPRRGLSTARNRGIAAAGGQIIAFTDDDVVVDPRWATAIAEAFATSHRVGCVTGPELPGELETPAQAMFELRASQAKIFELRRYDLHRSHGDPLFPFTPGRLGSGANMAFAASFLRDIGGFDTATGAGSLARGGDDLLVFFRTIAAGHSIVYTPDSLIWHHHRRTTEALERQIFGFGTGLGAFLTAAVTNEPQLIPALLHRLPRGLLLAVKHSRTASGSPVGWPRWYSLKERCGLLYGPAAYLRSRWRQRDPGSAPRRRAQRRRA